MKVVKIIIMTSVLVFVVLSFFTAKKQGNLIADVCALNNPTATSSVSLMLCKAKYLGLLTARQFDCKTIKQPACEILPNDTALCKQQIEQSFTTSTQANCEMEQACPNLLESYQKIKADCQTFNK